MRMSPLLIGMTLTLLVACEPQSAAPNFRQPTASGSVGTGSEVISPNDTTPKTTDSLEVGEPAPVLAVTKLSGSVLLGEERHQRITVYEDYGCFYCREFALSDLPWITRTYGAKLSIERVFVPMSPAGTIMAKTALCALKQDKFTEADTALHAKPIATDAEAALLAKNLTLNATTFRTCMGSQQTMDELALMKQRAEADGVMRVPSFAINDDRWIGVLTRENLQKKIENAF